MEDKRKKGRPPSPLRDRGIELLRTGLCQAQVARELCVPKGMVASWAAHARRTGVSVRNAKHSPLWKRGIQMLQQGTTALAVAEELGISIHLARTWARSIGRFLRPHLRPRPKVVPVLDLLIQGEPVSEIAEALEVSRDSIYHLRAHWLKGVKLAQ